MENAKNTFNFHDVHDEHHQRKRKLDKDGFVCPTTPDIPRNSHQFTEDGKQKKFDALETVPDFPTSDGDFGLGDGAFVSSYFKTGENDSQNGMTKNSSSCQLGTNSQSFELDLGGQTKNYPDHGQLTRQDSQGFEIGESFENLPEDKTNTYETINSGYNEEKIKLNYGTLSSQPNEEGAATQESAMNFMQSLVKGFEKESSAMFENWSKTFGQCGEYELLCQQKLDGMIQSAKSIEDSLNNKKDALCNRLKGIGKTLET